MDLYPEAPNTVGAQHAEYVAPPEVQFDLCGRQKLAPGFRRYEPCQGCGWLIGCGDAIDTIWHESCWEKR